MEAFYNDGIQLDLVCAEDQYKNWKEDEGLSFIYYSFLLDIGYKDELLKIECLEEQKKEKEVNLNNLMEMFFH